MKKIVVITASNLDTLESEKVESTGISQLVRKPLSINSLSKIFNKFETSVSNTLTKQIANK